MRNAARGSVLFFLFFLFYDYVGTFSPDNVLCLSLCHHIDRICMLVPDICYRPPRWLTIGIGSVKETSVDPELHTAPIKLHEAFIVSVAKASYRVQNKSRST